MLFIPASIVAQPLVCPLVNADMTPTCIEACIICNIDGYTGTHESEVNGDLPNDFCTFFVHNAQWIAFQAASENLTIQLTVHDCEINVGLEMAIYQSLDCENFQMVSNCLGGMGGIVGEGESGIFQNTVPLVVGQYYYLAMDGGMGDNCDWTLNVLQGSTELAPLNPVDEIIGNDTFCTNIQETYSIIPAFGATSYKWYVDGILVDSSANTSFSYIFPLSGTYNICVAPSNVCSTAPPSCLTIRVGDNVFTEIKDTICQGEIYNFHGLELTTSGRYTEELNTINGCDSTIILELVVHPQIIDTFSTILCNGDTIFTFMHTITEAGSYIDTFNTNIRCSRLTVFIIKSALSFVETRSVDLCDGDTLFTQQHVITMAGTYIDSLSSIEKCDSLIKYEVKILETKINEIVISLCEGDPININGNIYTQDTSFRLNLLSSAGCDSIVNYNISFKPKTRDSLNIELCQDDVVMINSIEISEAGVYTDTLINAQGCDSILTIIASEQICMIDWKQWTDQIDCFGQNTGQISITVQNGKLPIICSIVNTINGITKTDSLFNFTDTITFLSLPSGPYNIRLTDQNGNDTLTIVNILERPKLSVLATISNFNGYGVSCHNYNDGFITLDINGGTPPYNLKWSTGSADTLLSDLYAGNYEGLITDSLSCIQNISYQLKEPDSLYLRLAISENDCEQNASLSLVNPNGGVPPYTLSINGTELGGDGNGITLQPGQYNIIVLDNNGCEITDDFSLENAIDCEVLIPNIFSPNGNGTNDYFSVFVSEKFSGSFQSLKIFDRWGNLLYSLNEFMPNENLWDGTFLGKTVEQGVYTYLIEYTIEEKGKKVISGDVTIVR